MSESPFMVHVVCYSGYRGEETPRRFFIDGKCIEVDEVLDRWLAPDHRYFKLRSPEGDLYVLRHETGADCWELTLFESGSFHPP